MNKFSLFLSLLCILVCAVFAQAQSYSQFEREVLDEVNRVRSNPSAYAKWMEDNRNDLPYMPQPARLKVIDEAIKELKSAPSLPLLTVSPVARKSAEQHLNNQLPTGKFDHTGTDGSTADERMRRFGKLIGAYGENAIAMNPEDPLTAERLVLVWVIDDTIPNRGHRKLLLDRNYRVAGIACGLYGDFGIFPNYTLCVADFAQQLQ